MKRLIAALALAALICSCSPKLVIIHVNDTHSHLDPVRTGTEAGLGGVIERAAFIDSVRNKAGEKNVLLLHAGDWNQGTSYYSELHGELEVEMVNALKYDAITLGNHEFDNGIEDLTARVKKVKCPVVCANLDLRALELGEYVKPYTIVERGGLKIGIIGLETTLKGVVSSAISSRIPQYDAVEVTNKWASYLREKEGCNFIVLLSHQGYQGDCENAKSISGVDVIIGGHSHTFLEDFTWVEDRDGKKLPIIQDGCWGLNMGLITVR